MEAFGRASARADAIQIPIRLPGQDEDAETGLHYNWNRFCSHATGRYLTEDPLVSEVPGFGESVYGYARNNPTVYTNPDGRICEGPAPAKDMIKDSTGKPSQWKPGTKDVSKEMDALKEGQRIYDKTKSSKEATDLLDAIEAVLKNKKR
ncbi:MAG: RHS repeat-associated core domain-containing protein [Myxococcota bacterium]